jgi:hypothetical protein
MSTQNFASILDEALENGGDVADYVNGTRKPKNCSLEDEFGDLIKGIDHGYDRVVINEGAADGALTRIQDAAKWWRLNKTPITILDGESIYVVYEGDLYKPTSYKDAEMLAASHHKEPLFERGFKLLIKRILSNARKAAIKARKAQMRAERKAALEAYRKEARRLRGLK